MKKLLCALCVCLLLFSCLPAAAMTADERYERMQVIAQFIKQYGIDSSREDDPVMRALLSLFENEENYNAFMQAMLSSYDSHSMFVPSGGYETSFPTSETYVGVGLTMLAEGGTICITDVAPGSSAEKAGILPGDTLIRAAGVSLKGKPLTEVAALLRGEEGTSVSVTVLRDGRELSFSLTRTLIGTPNFSSRVVEDGVYYMKWARFADNASYVQFVFALQDMTRNGCRALILDLRGNPGGDLNMGYNVINRLLPDSLPFFGYTERQGEQRAFYPVVSEGIGAALNKIVVLCDGQTASAAEVVQVSLCDLGYAVSVGEQTYGKARGQYHITFDDGSAAVITAVELIAPKTADYEGVGLTPTYTVHNTQAPHPASSCASVPETVMAPGFAGEGVLRLHRALAALGFLPQKYASDVTFSLHTSAALMAFQQNYGLAPSPVLTEACAGRINTALSAFAGKTVTVDKQFEKALEIAREYAAQPAQYTVDELGNVTNLPR